MVILATAWIGQSAASAAASPAASPQQPVQTVVNAVTLPERRKTVNGMLPNDGD